MVAIRIAGSADAQGMLRIYAPYIRNTVITFENEVPAPAQFAERMQKGLEKFPWIVCLVNDEVAGYVYASAYRDREAYQWSCECSVYVHDRFHGKGLASELYSVLFQLLQAQGLKNVYAVITLPNEPSVRLHEKCGFEFFAAYDQVGYKLGGWQKVGWWRLQLGNYDPEPAPPLKFSALQPELVRRLTEAAERRVEQKING